MHQILIDDLREKAESGDAQAQCELARCYFFGDGVPLSNTEAAKWTRKAADQGRAAAQYMIGVCYEFGCGVSQDYTEAVRWLQKAALQGYDRAQDELGLCYDEGQGVPKNHDEAARWFYLAARQGDTEAQWHLGDYYTRVNGDCEKATKLFCLVAEKGDPKYQYATAKWYESGMRMPEDYDQAIKWYRLAAMQGHKHAQFELGFFYIAEKNNVEAYAWSSIYISAGEIPEEISLKRLFIGLIRRMTADEIKAGQELAEQYTLKIRRCTDDVSKR